MARTCQAIVLLVLAVSAASPVWADDSVVDALDDLTARQRAMAYACLADKGGDASSGTPERSVEDAMRACIAEVTSPEDIVAGVDKADAAEALAVEAPTTEELRAIDAGGHFYLGGVTETGSELLLRPDGTFAWILMYGAVNQSASGQWHREDGHVVLESAPLVPEPPTRISDFLPWSAAAERQLSHHQREQAREAVIERCPFMETMAYASTPAMAGVEQPSQDELLGRAAESARRLKTAAAVVETAARKFVMSDVGERQTAAVADAMDEYQSALAAAKTAHWAAGVDLDVAELEFPDECRLPTLPEDEQHDDPLSWQGGVAVRVGDAESKGFFSDFAVALTFSDGNVVRGVSNRSGWVVRPKRESRLASIEVGFPEGIDVPAVRLDVPPDQADSIAVIDVDLSALKQPAFKTMRLRIDGAGLIPTWPSGEERGRYQQ